jgi:uncharacterized protein YybS (DUF2232 family)
MYNRTSGVRGLVFGGLMAAMVVVFAMVPFLTLFMPIPLVLAYVRYGGRMAGMATLVAALFGMMFMGPLQTLVWMVPIGLVPGLVFGYGFRNKLQPATIAMMAVVVIFLASVGNYLGTRYALMGGRDPMADFMEAPGVREGLETVFKSMEQSAQRQTNPQARDAAMKQAAYMRQNLIPMMQKAIPAALFVSGVFVTWVNYSLCRWILPRFGHNVPRLLPFREWRLPIWLSILFLPVFFGWLYTVQTLVAFTGWRAVLVNIALPLMYLFALVGMAVAYGFLRKQDVPKPLAILFVLLGFFLGGLGIILYPMLAAWDSIYDFRGLGHGLRKRPEPTL